MVRRRISPRAQKAIHAEPHRGLPKPVCGESHLWAFPLKRSRSRGLDELPRGRHQEAKPVWTKPRSIVLIDWSKDPCSRVAARPFRSPSRKSRIASNAVGLHVNARSSTATSRSRSPRRACRRICRHGPHRRIALSPSRTASEASCLVAGSHHLEMVAPPAGSPPIAFGPSHITHHRVLFPKSHRHPTTHNPSSVNHFRPHATTAHSTINCTPRNNAEQEKYEFRF